MLHLAGSIPLDPATMTVMGPTAGSYPISAGGLGVSVGGGAVGVGVTEGVSELVVRLEVQLRAAMAHVQSIGVALRTDAHRAALSFVVYYAAPALGACDGEGMVSVTDHVVAHTAFR
jgi:hypothetical protein